MSSSFTIAKYVPAALCGLLVMVWLTSVFSSFGVIYRWPRSGNGPGRGAVTISLGTIVLWYHTDSTSPPQAAAFPNSRGEILSLRCLGAVKFYDIRHRDGLARSTSLWLPIPVLLTFLLPVAIGCLNRFRFSLWSWFVWTALVAAELAYYLH